MHPITEHTSRIPPPELAEGPGDDNRAVEVSITEPDGAIFSTRIDLADDTPPGQVAAALLSALHGVARAHSRMLSSLVQDAVDATARMEAEGERLTVSRLDEMAQQHIEHAGHPPVIVEIPGFGGVPFTTIRAILTWGGHI